MSTPTPPPPDPGQEPPPQDARPSQPPQPGEAATPSVGATGATGAPGQLAGVGSRIGARLIDAVLLAIVNFAVVVPIFVGTMMSSPGGAGAMPGMGFSGPGFLAGLITTAIAIVYFTFLEQSRGQTVGKMLLSLRTVGPDGGNPTLEEAFKRNSWYLLGLIPFVGWLAMLAVVIAIIVTMSNSPQNQGVHDNFAGGTRVLRAG